MLKLTFGEQVKIVLKRKNMTIKQLAEQIEIRTGMKMSRQNLTQRLGRDNFQEQDMRMIAEILDCPFQLNILEVEESDGPQVIEKIVEVEKIVEKIVEVEKKETFEPIKETIKTQEVEEQPVTNQREVTVEEVQPSLKNEAPNSKDGEINPYTGFEYKSNTVRSHPTRIGYVQVYDRKEHQWTDMTEWAFLGFQERQKLSLGKGYIEPTYLD